MRFDPITSGKPSPQAIERYERLVVQTPEILEKIERTKAPAPDLVGNALASRIRDNFLFTFDLSRPTRPVGKPCLFVNGRQDAIAGYQDMVDALDLFPRATLAILDRAGHSLSWEQPELFISLAQEWLRRVDESVINR